MLRASLIVAAMGWLGTAPFQCHGDDPARTREDTPADALLYLCGRFAAVGNDVAARATLDDLIDRYPSSHLIERAKEERAAPHPCADLAAEAPSPSATPPAASAVAPSATSIAPSSVKAEPSRGK